MTFDLQGAVTKLVNHFKAEADLLLDMAYTVDAKCTQLGENTCCLYLYYIGAYLIQMVTDAVLVLGMMRSDVTQRAISRVLMIRADSQLIDAYVQRGWVDQTVANRAKEALSIEEDRLQDLFNQLDNILNASYDELRQYFENIFDQFAQIYSNRGCQAVIAW